MIHTLTLNRNRTFLPMLRLYLLLLCPFVVADSRIRLLHRVYNPLEPPVQFLERGSLTFSASGVSYQPSEALPHDLQYFADSLQTLDRALYQVALEREGDTEEGHWDFSSVKAVSSARSISSFPPIIHRHLMHSVTCLHTLRTISLSTSLMLANLLL